MVEQCRFENAMSRKRYICLACGSLHKKQDDAKRCCFYNTEEVDLDGTKVVWKKGRRKIKV